jgi:cysteine desulfurase family protein
MTEFLERVGANPGRSGHHLSVKAARIVYHAREKIAELFNAPDPMRVIFTHNVTESLNLVLYGYLQPGDHLITSSMEHNSVMRPLRDLARRGVELTILSCSAEGHLIPEQIEDALQPNTVMIVLNHASNVCGTILPIQQAASIARQRGILLLVDTAQTAGSSPIDLTLDQIDLLAFTGHKSLLGPMGTGGLVIGERVDLERLRPLKRGGTGSRSEHEEQPEFLPDKYESGTANAVGLAGLGASLDWLLDKGIPFIRRQEIGLTEKLINGLSTIPGIILYGPGDPTLQTATVSFNISGLQPSEIGQRLDEEYGILCRVGLHCAPAAHQTLGSFPSGTVRFGMGTFTTEEDVMLALDAVRQIVTR